MPPILPGPRSEGPGEDSGSILIGAEALVALTCPMAPSLRSTALRLTLASARRVPASIRYPLERDGVDPVPRLEASRSRGDVVRLARLLSTRVWLVTGYDAA